MHDARVVSESGDHARLNGYAVNGHTQVNGGAGGEWYIYVQQSFDQVQFVALCGTRTEAEQIAAMISDQVFRRTGRPCPVRIERIEEAKAREHGLRERVSTNRRRGQEGDPALEAVAAWVAAAPEALFQAPTESTRFAVPEVVESLAEFRPAAAFPKGMAARLRMAARKGRKTKRVASKIIDGVVCYRVADVLRWWPDDLQKGVIARPGRRE